MNTFQSLLEDFEKANAQVLGVSVDSYASNKEFQDKLCTTFPLVSDFPKNLVSRAYDAYDEDSGLSKRVTVIIDRDHKVRGWYESREAETHPEKALKVLQSLK